MSDHPSFMHSVKKMFDAAVSRMDLSPGIAELLGECRSVYQVRFQVKINGEHKVFKGWRATHSEHHLPARAASAMRSKSTRMKSKHWPL